MESEKKEAEDEDTERMPADQSVLVDQNMLDERDNFQNKFKDNILIEQHQIGSGWRNKLKT